MMQKDIGCAFQKKPKKLSQHRKVSVIQMTNAIYISVDKVPSCPVHGPMKSRVFLGSDLSEEGPVAIVQVIDYICVGFDGEGCETKGQMEYQFIGWADEVNFEP
jgi:hypothetical protein